MALIKTAIKREFKYKGKILDDIPGFTEQEVLKHYASTNPELVNAKFQYKGMTKSGIQQYEFITDAGTNG